MPNYTVGNTRVVLKQPDLTTYQGNGSVVLDSRRARPLWFDGRFLAASDLEREQNYFLQRQADLGQAAGFGVMHGLLVSRGPSTGQPPSAETIVIGAGDGITPAGELVMLPSDLTIQLSDLAEEESLNLQFGLSTMPQQPARTRTGLYVIALRPVEFTANPITSYPTSISGPRTTHDGDIVEATAVSLVPYTNPVNNSDPTQQQAAVARQVFLTGNAGALSDSLLPLAMISIQRGAINWIDPYMVRRDSGPQNISARFGLTDPATQQAFLLQYNTQLQAAIATRQSSGLNGNFAATDYFQALPPAGPFPLDAINVVDFSQTFFPQQMDVRLSVIPADELPALVEDGMSLPPIDLTLAGDAYANLAVFALIPVPRNIFASLKSSLPDTPLNPTMPQVLANRTPIQLLRLFQGSVNLTPVPPVANSAWRMAIGTQKFGFYVRRRSEAVYVDFTTVALSSSQNPSPFGQAMTLTAKVTPASATGTIQFNDGTTALGAPVTLINGSASSTVSSLSGGVHSITAVYSGDGSNAASTSAVLTQTISTPSTVALSSSANPSTLGQSVTFTATVLPGSATGNVQFNDGATALGTVPLSGSGSAVLTVSTLAVGAHSITAAYSGDASDAGNTSPALTQTVNPLTSSMALASSPNPATIGQGVTFTASITPNTATGTVRFLDGATSVGAAPLIAGKATLTVSSLAVGAHSITAAYGGDTNDAPSTSAALIQTISAAASGVVASSSPNPSTVGQAVTLTATVTPGTATGTVQFRDGATALSGPVAVSGGKAALPVTTLAVGAHSITAVYSGDASNATSTSAVLTQAVNQVASSVQVTSALDPATSGQAVPLTATVTPSTATGTVQFADGTTALGTAPLGGGKASLSVSSLAVGTHAITATYTGDTNDAPSASPALSQRILQLPTTAAVTSSQNPSTLGQSVTLSATVTPASATGTVQFKDGAANLGAPVSVNSGTATLPVSSLTLGSHSITAVYSGDTNNAGSTSPAVSQVVTTVASKVVVTSSVNPSVFGQSVVLMATATPGSATGTVQFQDGAANLGAPVPLSGGQAALPATTLSVGTHSITAAYSGDASDAASTSPAIIQTVNQVGSSVVVTSSANPSTLGQSVTLTAAVTPSSASGTVQFRDGTAALGSAAISNAKAALAVPTLSVGAHSITAAYSGDANDLASTSSVLTQTVNQVATTVALTSSPNPSALGQSVTFVAAVTPSTASGTIQFRDGTTALGAVPLAGGKATLADARLTVGAHAITAAYSGDANDTASTSPILTQTITPAGVT